MTLVETKERDNRPLKEILEEINEVASSLNYLDHRLIQEDLTEIWMRYTDEGKKIAEVIAMELSNETNRR